MTLLVGGLLADAASVRPGAVAATLGAESMTFEALDREANRTANALVGLGLVPGQILAWWARPRLESLAGFAASARTGAVFAPVNPSYGEDEARQVLDYLHPQVLVVDDDHRDAAQALRAGSGTKLVALADLEELARGASAHPPDLGGRIRDVDPHVVYLTSGTTGRPKGVVVSHRASWLRAFPGGSTFATGLRRDGGILPSFPLFHYGGWHYVLEAWHHRCAFHMCERFDGPSLVDAARTWRPAAMYCIPAVWNRVLEAAPDGDALRSVAHADTGTSAAPPELIRRLQERMPEATTSVLYGSSEGGHHTTLTHRDSTRKPGSVGRVAPPGVISISGESEILYRSPTVMSGYLELPDETEAALSGGWYHTGDLGVLDDEGYLYVTGRVREMIRTGGESVAPPEVEAALDGCPGARDLAVVGVPDSRWGEVVCAVVVVEEGHAPPTVSDVRSHLDGRLADFKHPRRVVVVDSVPRTAATGQVQRTLLREMVTAVEMVTGVEMVTEGGAHNEPGRGGG